MNPHQMDAALFALASPLSQGVLLADEVGLGKTIEASLVIAQRWAERRRRILLIVPASLRKQWSQELYDKFSLPYPQNYLALCPNHSAMYRLVNSSTKTMREAFQALSDNELDVVLAEQDMTIYFSKTHIVDLTAILDAEDSLSAGQDVEPV